MGFVARIQAAARRHPDLAELALGVSIGLIVAVVSLSQWGLTDTGIARAVILGVPLAALTGWTYRRRRQRDEARELAFLEQRVRLARELHDAVASQVAIIGIQAAAARRILEAQPDEAARALERIETASRTAVGDLRRMLLTLREGADPIQSLSAAPGLAQLDNVVDDALRNDLRVVVRVSGSRPAELPAALDHAAYRIVQEAVTNALKHANPGEAAVDIAYEPESLGLRIRTGLANGVNEGKQTDGAGLGLRGIRERAAIFGGDVFAGPTPAGDWLVDVRLPWGSGDRRE